MINICMIRGSRQWREEYVPDVGVVSRLAQEWGKVFLSSYAEYRQRLRQIHEATVAVAGFDLVLNAYDPALQDWIKAPGALIYPIDDDDWVSSRLVDVLRSTDMGEAVALRWQNAMLCESGLYVFGRHRQEGRYCYSTNNYAVRTPCPFELLYGHDFADEFFGPSFDREVYVEEMLSINNKNLGSMSFKRSGLSLVEIARLFKEAECPHNLPSEFYGAYQSLSEVYRDLTPRRLF